MRRKTAPWGAMLLARPETPLHRRPILWLAVVGSLVMVVVMGLSFSDPPATDHTAETSQLTEPEMPAVLAVTAATVDERVVPERPPELPWRNFTVGDGDNLSLIFNRAGFSDTDLYRVAVSNTDRSLKRVYPGEIISFQSDLEGELLALRHVQSPLMTTHYAREDQGYSATDIVREPERAARNVSMTIDTSLFLAGTDAGLSDAMIMELAGIFGGVIDFALDPRSGDTIHVVYEELLLDGQRFDDGPILATSFTNRGETLKPTDTPTWRVIPAITTRPA